MLTLIAGLRELEGMILARSENSRARFEGRGQLLPRDRLNLLLDRGAPWLELSTTAGYKTYDDDGGDNISGARLITGIGMVSDVRCMVIVDDSGILAGALHTHGVDKMIRAFDLALENKLPVIHLVQSAGADLLDYVPATWVRAGGMFYKQAQLSAAGCPVISVVQGSSTAGGPICRGCPTTWSWCATRPWPFWPARPWSRRPRARWRRPRIWAAPTCMPLFPG
jgi:geranyl-CoA carboxylase beta subunit